MTQRPSFPIGALIYFGSLILLGLYFTFAAVQGDYGVFRRADVMAERAALRDELSHLRAELQHMEALTTRLSDEYLDPDLLDERARDVLGLIRGDEIVIR